MQFKQKQLLLLLCMVLLVGSLAAQMQSATLRIYFPTGKFDLNAATKARLDSLADSLAHQQRYEIALRGHADSQGDSLANLRLSEKRAAGVNAYLTGKGLRIRDVRSLGQREPLNAAKTPEAMARNRRVDILVRYWPKPKALPMPEIAEIVDTTTIDDLLKKLRKPDQVYCINPLRDTVLTCAQGAVLHFKAGSFKQSATCPDGCVTIRVREVYKKSEQVLDHLNTMSNKQLLESSGMIYTRAEDCNGKPIGLLPGMEMTAFLPAAEALNGEQLFYGHRRGADSVMNWHGAMPVRGVSQTGLKDIWCGTLDEGDGQPCRFFWCKIKRFFRKLFGIKEKAVTKEDRENGCNKLKELCEKYQIQDPEALRRGLYAQFVKKLGYKSLEEMFAKADPIKLDSIIANFHDDEMQNPDLRFNYFSTPSLGWNNIDRFMKYPPNMITNVIVECKPDIHTRCMIIFKNDHVLAEGYAKDLYKYELDYMPRGEPATLIVMRYFNAKAYLCMQDIKIAPGPFMIELKEVTFEEFEKALHSVNY